MMLAKTWANIETQDKLGHMLYYIYIKHPE
jgi:hypothetical protein